MPSSKMMDDSLTRGVSVVSKTLSGVPLKRCDEPNEIYVNSRCVTTEGVACNDKLMFTQVNPSRGHSEKGVNRAGINHSIPCTV